MASNVKEYLIQGKEEMVGLKLPSIGDVLSYFIFHNEKYFHKKTLREIAKITVEKAFEFYDKAEIPTHPSAVDKVLKLYDKYKELKRNKHLNSALQKKREEDFTETFDDLFDLSATNVENSLKNKPVVRDFLIKQQQKGRPGTMEGILAQRQRASSSFADAESSGPSDRSGQSSYVGSDVSDITGSLSSISVDDTKNDPDYEAKDTSTEDSPPTKVKKQELITNRIVGVIDTCRISLRCAVHFIVAILLVLGLDPRNYSISASTILKRRKALRESMFEQIKEKIDISRGAVVHFDGKLMSAITGKEKVDRLAIKVTYKDVDQLLGVPISNGTGLEIAVAVFNCLKEWKIIDFIDGVCFDTTGTNTGIDNGAAVFLEHFLGRTLLYLPCRHHMFELILRLVFETKVSATTEPKVPMFGKFQRAWDKIDQSKYVPGIKDPEIHEHLRTQIKPMTAFIEEQMKNEREKKTLRADYYELLELSLLFLGGKLPKKPNQVIFHPPGAFHHARWMAKAIYSLKIFLFREQFKGLTSAELRGLGIVNVFIIRFYLKLWFRSTKPHRAANLDLEFIHDMIGYTKIDNVMSRLILNKFSRHLWYLSEEAVGMAFFDDSISLAIKRKMVKNLRLGEATSSEHETTTDESNTDTTTESESASMIEDDTANENLVESDGSEFEYREEEDFPFDCDDENEGEDDSNVSSRAGEEFADYPHKVKVTVEEIIQTYANKDVSDFVTKVTNQFFRRFGIATDFLHKDPATWSTDESYKNGLEIVQSLKVVNDTAERGIQLISYYNQIMTKSEQQTQFLLQVVEFFRRKYPSFNIRDLI